MYYKEKIIDGILCFTTSKDGDWIQMSPQKLTKKIVRMKVEIERLMHKLEVASRKVHEPI